MKGIQDTSSKTLRQLLGNGLTYEIPKFQRDYSWTSEQWDDLWQDIQAVINGEEPGHYLGYLVLQSKDDKHYKVIDGQQRITTISILILGVIRLLKKMVEEGVDAQRNEMRMEAFRNSYIGYLDPVTLIPKNKLSLNRHNDRFFSSKLVPLEKLPLRGLNASERLMKNCFEWFVRKLEQTYSTGEKLAAFIDTTVDKLFFTVIAVNDELNAFKVFETLNARGVQLSSSDLLKNYLFSVVDANAPHPTEIAEVESAWSTIMGKLGSEKFAEFLRFYWNSHFKTVRKNDLFKTIRRNIRNKAEVFELIRNLERSADVFIALKNPDDELWRGREQVSRHLRVLKIFQVRQPFSLLLAGYEDLGDNGFQKLLKHLTILSFRYNLIAGRNPNDQEVIYNELALSIRKDQQYHSAALKRIDLSDDVFATSFSNKEFPRTSRNHKIVKYILGKIEREKYAADLDLTSDQYTVEHILPESIDENWAHIPDDEYGRCVFRLGNLAVLEARLNKESGTESYAVKKGILEQSSVHSTKVIPARYAEWGEEQINSRQRQLAKLARSIWQIPT